jgi:hypothetical protein
MMNAMTEAGESPVITVIGGGTVGSCILELLARQASTNRITLVVVDYDRVEHHNLSKSALFLHKDIGLQKATAICYHLRQIRPEIRVVPIPLPVEALRSGIFRASDLVVAAVDNRLAKFHINRYSRAAGTPHLLVAELEGGRSLAARIRCLSPGPNPAGSPCMECMYSAEDYQLLDHLRRPCTREKSGVPVTGADSRSGRLSPAWRLAAETVEEIENCLGGQPTLSPGQEVRLLPEQRQCLILRGTSKPDCLCPHTPSGLELELEGDTESFTIGDLITQLDLHLGPGWTWIIEPSSPDEGWPYPALTKNTDGILCSSDLYRFAGRVLAFYWPAGDIIRLVRESGEILYARLPLKGLLSWYTNQEDFRR